MHNRGRRRRGIYYPWSIVGLSFLTVGVAFGCRSTFAVFLIPIIEEFHWSRGLTAGVLFLGALVWSLAAPLIGILLDRLGARVLFSLGAVIMALGFIVSSISQNILLFYTGMGVLESPSVLRLCPCLPTLLFCQIGLFAEGEQRWALLLQALASESS
ncbi:MAG: MFS transporter [Candidatus Binatia bacterium]